MLNKFNRLLDALFDESESAGPETIHLEIACSVLLIEVMKADGEISAQEQQQIKKVINQQFSCSHLTVDEIFEQGFAQNNQAIDLFQFTRILNQHYSLEQRISMIHLLWKIAYADGVLSTIEEHTIKRIAELLHLRRSEYIATKPAIK